MASGRMLMSCICDSERMWQLSTDASRLLYTWLISWLDINGVFIGSPRLIKQKVWPIPDDEAHGIEAVEKYLNEMEQAGLIARYDAGGKSYIWFPDFHEKQVFSQNYRESPKYPTTPEIQKHNLEIRGTKMRLRTLPPPSQQQPQQTKPKSTAIADLAEVHSYWEKVHKKNTGEFITLTEADKAKMIALIDKYDGKVIKCLDFMYANYAKKYWQPDLFLKHFNEILGMV